jgi:ribosomal 50S subunit-associated protein YjgA (DUF615 family)
MHPIIAIIEEEIKKQNSETKALKEEIHKIQMRELERIKENEKLKKEIEALKEEVAKERKEKALWMKKYVNTYNELCDLKNS